MDYGLDRIIPKGFRAAKIRGVQLAIVDDNKDGPENPGYRVKVKFPWMNDQDTTYWARIAVHMAGNERGTYTLPEIGDQVLVAFEHGDINRPIVIGSLWSKQQEPPEPHDTGENNTKLIKSRSGHRIIFSDKDGSEKVIIVDKTKKNKIVLDSANKLVKVESAGDIEIKGQTNIVIHSDSMKVGTTEGFTGKGQQVLTHAAATFGVKADANCVLNGGQVQINVAMGPATQVSGSGSGSVAGLGSESAGEQITEQSRSGGGGGGSGGGPSPN